MGSDESTEKSRNGEQRKGTKESKDSTSFDGDFEKEQSGEVMYKENNDEKYTEKAEKDDSGSSRPKGRKGSKDSEDGKSFEKGEGKESEEKSLRGRKGGNK